MSKIVLRDFQLEAVNKLVENEEKNKTGSVLAFEMGLGKTLTFASFLLKQREKENQTVPDLIIVPLCVLLQWKTEILRLDEDADVFIYHGLTRVKQLRKAMSTVVPEFVISTYHSLVTKELEQYQWNRIVLDEAHTIRNGIESKFRNVPKRALGAFSLKAKSRFRHCITGTPFNNGKNDLLSLMKFIDDKFDDGDVFEFVANFVIQKTKENIIDPISFDTVLIKKPEDKMLTEYKSCLKSYGRVLHDMKRRNNLVEIRNLYRQAMMLMTKLRLFCDIMQMETKKEVLVEDPDIEEDEEYEEEYEEVEMDDEDKLEFYDSSIKIKTIVDKVTDSIETVPFKRIIIFSSFVTTLEILGLIIKNKKENINILYYTGKMDRYEREEIVNKFTDAEETTPMILCATLGAGSCGLNLTPCSTVYLADISINPFDQLQAINRVHRITQKNKVNVTKFCMQNMIEENILNSHINKFSEAKSNGLIMV
jgi:SWI/SNF-related matrix-associated actin-dependent regulator of chromatin subfamily A member 5